MKGVLNVKVSLNNMQKSKTVISSANMAAEESVVQDNNSVKMIDTSGPAKKPETAAPKERVISSMSAAMGAALKQKISNTDGDEEVFMDVDDSRPSKARPQPAFTIVRKDKHARAGNLERSDSDPIQGQKISKQEIFKVEGTGLWIRLTVQSLAGDYTLTMMDQHSKKFFCRQKPLEADFIAWMKDVGDDSDDSSFLDSLKEHLVDKIKELGGV